MPLTVYDKVSWHFPDGKGCPSLEAAAIHIRLILNWLRQRGHLSAFGEQIASQAIGEDTSITSEMLTPKGNLLLKTHYDEWLETIEYENLPSEDFWNKRDT